jgi:hypothetical protein
MMSVHDLAAANFERHLQHNPYPGRGLVVGRTSVGADWLMVYWIMGRSAHSRNRRLVIEGSTLHTEPVDINQVADPSLIIYDAMLELPGIYLVGNGDQVRTVYDALLVSRQFDEALATREREPDAPHYTPRISAMLNLHTSPASLSLNILKANPADSEATDRFTYRPAAPPAGFGLCLTTYLGNANPLPSFSGEPLLLPLEGTADQVLDTYWNALDADHRLAIAVKQIPQEGGASTLTLHNRYESALSP